MTQKIITDSSEETVRIIWDGTRFIIISVGKGPNIGRPITIIILNPREMMDIVQFASNLGGK